MRGSRLSETRTRISRPAAALPAACCAGRRRCWPGRSAGRGRRPSCAPGRQTLSPAAAVCARLTPPPAAPSWPTATSGACGPLQGAAAAAWARLSGSPPRSETALHRAGTLVGQDGLGNKYYENNKYQARRPRRGWSPAPDGGGGLGVRLAAIAGSPTPTRRTTAPAPCRASGALGAARGRARGGERAARAGRAGGAGASPPRRSAPLARSLPVRHSWLHHITDAPPTRVAQYVPVYAAPAQGGVAYGTPGFGRSTAYAPQVHLPQGHLKRGRRSWARFEAWAPN